MTLKISAANHTEYLCVLCGSENNQRLFHCTALTGWFLSLRRSVFTARYESNIYIQFGLFTAKPWIRSQANLFAICSGQSGTETVFTPSSSVFPLSLSFHQRPTLIFIYMLLLSEGLTRETWEFRRTMLFGASESIV